MREKGRPLSTARPSGPVMMFSTAAAHGRSAIAAVVPPWRIVYLCVAPSEAVISSTCDLTTSVGYVSVDQGCNAVSVTPAPAGGERGQHTCTGLQGLFPSIRTHQISFSRGPGSTVLSRCPRRCRSGGGESPGMSPRRSHSHFLSFAEGRDVTSIVYHDTSVETTIRFLALVAQDIATRTDWVSMIASRCLAMCATPFRAHARRVSILACQDCDGMDQPKPRSAQQTRHKRIRFAYYVASAPLRPAS
jgi:hypothetical protein